MGLGKWLEQIGESVGDTARKITGQPRTAREYTKMKKAKEKRLRKSYSGAGDAARKREIERQTGM